MQAPQVKNHWSTVAEASRKWFTVEVPWTISGKLGYAVKTLDNALSVCIFTHFIAHMYRAVESGQSSEKRNVLRGKSGFILSSYASRDNLSPMQRQQQLSLIKSGFATNHAFKQRMKFCRKNIPIFNFHLKALLSLVLMRRCKSIKLLTLAVRYKPWSGCVAFWFIWSLSNVVCMWLLAGCCRVRLVKLERSAWFATDIPLWILF